MRRMCVWNPPPLVGPVSGGVDHAHNCDRLHTALQHQRVGDDIGQARHRFLVGARHPPGASGRHVDKGQCSAVQSVSDTARR